MDFNHLITYYKNKLKGIDNLILIGHSLGGIIVQKLINDGIGMAGIAINSGPSKGIFAWNLDFLISNLALMSPFNRDKLILMSTKWFHRYVTNEMSFEETEKFIKENGVPSSRLIVKTIGKSAYIDFKKPHVPLLFIAGDKDRSQPAVINYKNYKAYTDTQSVRTYRVFEGRTHNCINQDNWLEIAEYIRDWLHSLKH